MHSRSFAVLVTITFSSLSVAACTATLSSPLGSLEQGSAPPAANQGAAAATADLGKACNAACGSGKSGVECATVSDDCSNKFCLVAPSKITGSLAPIAYCSVGCETTACASGYHCETIKDFSHTTNDRACMANPEVCGNGIVELGEACDSTKDGRECAADCRSYVAAAAMCGDGHPDVGEECDGDTMDTWCSSDCKIAMPAVRLINVTMSANVGESSTDAIRTSDPVGGELPVHGDISGCGEVKPLEIAASYVRFQWKYCDGGRRATWTFALPMQEFHQTSSAALAPALKPTLMLESGRVSVFFDGPSTDTASLDATFFPERHSVVGRFRFEQMKWGVAGSPGGRSSFSAMFGMTPPHRL